MKKIITKLSEWNLLKEEFNTIKELKEIVTKAGFTIKSNDNNLLVLTKDGGISLNSVEDTEIDYNVTVEYFLYKELTCKLKYEASSPYAKGWKYSADYEIFDDIVDYDNLQNELTNVVTETLSEIKYTLDGYNNDAVESYYDYKSGNTHVEYEPDLLEEASSNWMGYDSNGVPQNIKLPGLYHVSGAGFDTDIALLGFNAGSGSSRPNDGTVIFFQDDYTDRNDDVDKVEVKKTSLKKMAKGETILAKLCNRNPNNGAVVKIKKITDLNTYLDAKYPNSHKTVQENKTELADWKVIYYHDSDLIHDEIFKNVSLKEAQELAKKELMRQYLYNKFDGTFWATFSIVGGKEEFDARVKLTNGVFENILTDLFKKKKKSEASDRYQANINSKLSHKYPNFKNMGYDEEDNLLGNCTKCGTHGALVIGHKCNMSEAKNIDVPVENKILPVDTDTVEDENTETLGDLLYAGRFII